MRRLLPLLLAGAALLAAGCDQSGTSGAGGTAPAANGPSQGGKLRLGMMPKKVGIPYFNACEKGARRAAEDLGDVDLTYDGPSESKSEDQSQLIDTWVTRQFDAIAVACNDPDQIAASLARARDADITVVTFDADANPETSKRQFFVNQAGVEDIAKALVDEMASQVGEDAEVGVVSSSPTAPNQSAWLKAMDAYAKQAHPKLKVVVTEYAEESPTLSLQKAQSILKAYPNVKGIYGMTSVAFPGAAKAVEDAGKGGQIAVVGLGLPSEMRQYVEKGVVKTVILWNPEDLGYLTVEVARAVEKGELMEGDTTFRSKLGEKKVVGSEVLLGPPMRFDRSNIARFEF